MQTLVIMWQPNDKWHALPSDEKKNYLLSLDTAVNEARSHGVMTLGWSKIDTSLPLAPAEGYVGVFAMSSIEDIHGLEQNVGESGWYDYFDSVNLSISPEGGTNPLPSREYAKLLDIDL